MQPTSPVNAVAVKKEEKEAKLREFVAACIGAADAASSPSPSIEASVLLVARSCDSPVVSAVKSLQPELTSRGIAVCALLTCDPADHHAAETAAIPGWTVRCLPDARFRDAHEQLVFGTASAWIGDCMRREPLKRDAFEIYAAACAQTAGYGLRSFRQLWQAGRSLDASKSIAAADRAADAATTCAVVATMAEQAADAADAPKAMTRQ